MTLKEAAQQALEALDCIYSPLHVREINKVGAAMVALRQALANEAMDRMAENERELGIQMQADEPHSWYSAEHDEWMTNKTREEHETLNSYTHKVGGFDLPLYTHPQRKWVGLTDEEIKTCAKEHLYCEDSHYRVGFGIDGWDDFAKDIEAKLKQKNGG